ncbi:MAG: hypothetical protein GQ470_02430 [Gammaproteobacteria bacterium]|nr:hypothetical protein [Gammaproteobacteria bacterium]
MISIKKIIGLVFFVGALLLLMPDTDDASRNMIASGSMLLCIKDYRESVAQQVLSHTAAFPVFDDKCPKFGIDLKVNTEGVITLYSETYKLTMTLTPQIDGDEVSWSCYGEPEGNITALCKP